MLSADRVLYAHNIYYQGRKEWGATSSWEITWGNSLERCFGEGVLRFNPDVFGPDSHVDSDAALLQLVRDNDIQLLVMISHIGVGWTREFIAPETLGTLQRQGIKIVSIWGDITHASERRALNRLRPNVDLNVCTATSAAASRLAARNPILYSWVPISDERVERRCDCGALVSLAGSVRRNRKRTVEFLRSHGIEVHTADGSGGEGVSSLPREEYLRMLAHPMTLGFSTNGYECVTNARTFEALTQGTVLLEGWGRETAKIFRPYDDYVPWHSHKDLLNKIRALTLDPGERQRIAENGRASVARFTHDALWSRVLFRVGLADTDHGLDFLHPVDWGTYQGPHRRLSKVIDRWMEAPGSDPAISALQRIRERLRWVLNVGRYHVGKLIK